MEINKKYKKITNYLSFFFCLIVRRLNAGFSGTDNRIWWLCLLPTSTTRLASDRGYRMEKKIIGFYKEILFMNIDIKFLNIEHEFLNKDDFGLHGSVIFRPQCVWFLVHLYVALIPNSSGQLLELFHIIPPEYIWIVIRFYWKPWLTD